MVRSEEMKVVPRDMLDDGTSVIMDFSVPEDHNQVWGNELAGELQVTAATTQEFMPVTAEELDLLVDCGVRKDMEVDDLSYPPEVEEVVKKAAEFFETYLADTNVNRVDVTDRYVAALIDELEARQGQPVKSPEDLEAYVMSVHSVAEASEEVLR